MVFDIVSFLMGTGTGDGGTTILSGTDAPAGAQGRNGDVYLQYKDNPLPVGYTPAEYLQSSGGQYIDTGIAARVQLKVEVDCQWMSSGDQTVIGGSSNINNNAVYLGYNSTNGKTYVGYAKSWHDFSSQAVNQSRHKWTTDLQTGTQTMTVDDTVYATTSNTFTETSSTTTLYLFARSGGGASFIGKIYEVVIYDYLSNGDLVRHFIPAIRDADGVAGMYDLVGNTFYANIGSGSFTAGPLTSNAITDTYSKVNGAWQALIGTDIDDIDLGGGTIESLSVTQNGTYSPSGTIRGYAPVTVNVQGGGDDSFTLTKYIQSSGTQYINTEYVPISTTRFEVVADVQAYGSYPALFGERTSVPSGVVVFIRYANSNNLLSMQWGDGDIAFDLTYWSGGWFGVKCKYILADGTRSVFDADGYGFSGTKAAGTGASLPIYIFALNENNSPNSVTFCSCKLYRFRIYEGNNLVHEFIPWEDNGVACLKDTVTETLKYNAGTGSFVYGEDT